jgi:cyclic pyranopterin phosphate synthase
MPELSHFDSSGQARMVPIGEKAVTRRQAVARGRVILQPQTLDAILNREVQKGDVLGIARISGIMAAKKTPDLIPLCHPLALISVELSFRPNVKDCEIIIESKIEALDRTGVEMEALTAVSVAALTIYDMCKSMDRSITISDIRLIKKTGGKSGTFLAPEKRKARAG